MADDRWFVYILECSDLTYYTGVTKDLDRRLLEHNQGRGASYTRGRTPVRLIGRTCEMDKREAFRLEWRIKRLPRRKKLQALCS